MSVAIHEKVPEYGRFGEREAAQTMENYVTRNGISNIMTRSNRLMVIV